MDIYLKGKKWETEYWESEIRMSDAAIGRLVKSLLKCNGRIADMMTMRINPNYTGREYMLVKIYIPEKHKEWFEQNAKVVLRVPPERPDWSEEKHG